METTVQDTTLPEPLVLVDAPMSDQERETRIEAARDRMREAGERHDWQKAREWQAVMFRLIRARTEAQIARMESAKGLK